MALSDALATMSAQAKEAEDEFHVAQSSQRAKLEEEITRARTSAEQSRGALRNRADDAKSEVSSGWRDLQQQWERQVQKIRTNVAEKRDEHDAKFAAMQADMAEADAEFAVAIAQAAIEEAEYAALEAVLARGKATELAATR
jgi:HD-GYP domain-containing protein (c-di-GMP phosphodiesterase class II)